MRVCYLTPKFSCSRINKSERSEQSFARLTAATHVRMQAHWSLRSTSVNCNEVSTFARARATANSFSVNGPLTLAVGSRPGESSLFLSNKKYSTLERSPEGCRFTMTYCESKPAANTVGRRDRCLPGRRYGDRATCYRPDRSSRDSRRHRACAPRYRIGTRSTGGQSAGWHRHGHTEHRISKPSLPVGGACCI